MAFVISNGLCTLADVRSALHISDTADDDRLSLAIDSASRLIETRCNRRFWQDPLPRIDTGCVLDSTATVDDASVVATDVGRQVLDPTNGFVASDAVISTVSPGVSFTLANFEGSPRPVTGSGTQSLTIGLTPRRYVSQDPWLVEIDDVASQTGLVIQSDYAGDGTFTTAWGVADWRGEPVNGIMQGQSGWPMTKVRAIRSLYFPVWGGISYPKPYTQALVQLTARWGWAAVPSQVNKAAILQSIALLKADDVPFGATPFAELGIVRLKSALHPMVELLLTPYREDPVLVA